MKKLISLIMAFGIVLSLTSCGGGRTAEDLLQSAEEFSAESFYKDIEENELRAEENYKGNIFTVTGFVKSIDKDYVTLGDLQYEIRATLPTDELKLLSTNEQVTIVGEFSSIEKEKSTYNAGPMAFDSEIAVAKMDDAHLVTDTYEITGNIQMCYMKLMNTNGSLENQDGDKNAWCLMVVNEGEHGNTNEYHIESEVNVEHIEGRMVKTVNIGGSDFADNDTITLSGKIFDRKKLIAGSVYPTYRMEDIELVK